METVEPDLQDLSAFAVLIEAGSFTRAAERLGCSKGQLSKRMRVLEQSLGVVLLHRTTRRLTLTPAGEALLPEAQALNAQALRARQAVASQQDGIRGPVRVSVPISLGETFLDAWLKEFSLRYPAISLELELANERRDLVSDGFDLAIRTGVGVDERLVARPLFALQEITCATPDYLAAHGEPATPAALASHRCLLNSHSGTPREWLYQRHHELFRVPVSGALACNQYSLLKHATLMGAGIGRLPSYMVQQELADGRLLWLLREYQTRSTPVFLVHPYQGALPKRVQLLVDYLQQWFERSRRQLIDLEQ